MKVLLFLFIIDLLSSLIMVSLRITWPPRIKAGTLLLRSSDARSALVLKLGVVPAVEKALIFGRHTAFLEPDCTQWKICWPIAIGAKLPSEKWVMTRCSAMLERTVRSYTVCANCSKLQRHPSDSNHRHSQRTCATPYHGNLWWYAL
jgi:hypothetical protein